MKKIVTNKIYISLFAIVLVGGILRFWGLGSVPPSLYWDEVSQAYNAYSILETGKDEHQEFFPITRFQAFGDYKAPVYIYLDVASLFLFGKSEFAVRLPSAFLGSLTVLLTYFLAREIFFTHKKRDYMALLASFLLAISPWHIQLSRAAYEGNVATFFTVLGILLFFLGKRKNPYLFFASTTSFVLAFYSFNAHRVFIPIIVLFLITLFLKELLKYKMQFVLSGIFAIVLLLPFLFYLQNPESRLRFQEVNIFSEIATIEESNKLQEVDNNSIFSKALHNRRLLFAQSYLENYFDFFNPSYLFFTGDVNPRFSTQENGQLYLIMLPFILIGIYVLLKNPTRNTVFLVGWIILAPIAAATARETPHALRSETFIPAYEIVAAFGVIAILGFIATYNKKIVLFAKILLAVGVLYYFVDFAHTYFFIFPAKYSQDWQYGYKMTVEKVEEMKKDYDEIIFTNAYGRAYIYVLWYGNYNPKEFWNKGKMERDAFGFYKTKSFDKYTFSEPKTYANITNRKVLFISPANGMPQYARRLHEIKFLNGSEAFIIGDNL